MGIPGPVLSDGYVEVCVNLGWHNANPQEELSKLLDGIPERAAMMPMWQPWERCGRAAAWDAAIWLW